MLLAAISGSVLVAACLATAAGQPPVTSPKPHSRAETLALIRKDVAAHEHVEATAVTTVREEDRIWDDEDLGCVARKGLQEPSPVPGYLFVVRVGQQTWEYHTDRLGRIKRCPPAKPKTAGR
jgi:hypothetical protein